MTAMGVLPSDSAAVGSEPFGIRDDRKDAYVSDNTLVIVESPAKAKKIAILSVMGAGALNPQRDYRGPCWDDC